MKVGEIWRHIGWCKLSKEDIDTKEFGYVKITQIKWNSYERDSDVYFEWLADEIEAKVKHHVLRKQFIKEYWKIK